MPAKRSTSAKPNGSNMSPASPLSPAVESTAASSSSSTSALPEARVSATVAAALSRNSNVNTNTTSSLASANGSKKVAAGFFEEADRVYDRSTTRMLNDFAGFIVIFVGMIYFTLSGYFLYRETYGMATVSK